MPTSSITKDFFVQGQPAFERLKAELSTEKPIKHKPSHSKKSMSLAKRKVANFVFAEQTGRQ